MPALDSEALDFRAASESFAELRKLAATAAENLLEFIMRRYEPASTLLTSNRPVDGWGKLLGDTPAVTAMLDRLLHHAHILECAPKSWHTKLSTTSPLQEAGTNRETTPVSSMPIWPILTRQRMAGLEVFPGAGRRRRSRRGANHNG